MDRHCMLRMGVMTGLVSSLRKVRLERDEALRRKGVIAPRRGACYNGGGLRKASTTARRAPTTRGGDVMNRTRARIFLLLTFVLVAGQSPAPLYGQPASDPPAARSSTLVLLKSIETGGQPSAVVVDQAAGRNDVIFYDGDRVRFIDGDALTLTSAWISLPTTAWEGWMAYDTYHQQAYVVTIRRRETPMRVAWQEAQVHVVADRALLNSFSVNGVYNEDPLAPADRFYGLNGLGLKEANAEGTHPARLILDDTANGNVDVVDLTVTGTDAGRRQRYSYRDSLCSGAWCTWQTNQGNTLALETRHETAAGDDLASVDVLYVADLNLKDGAMPLYGHLHRLQLGHPGQDLNAVPLAHLDLSETWPFGNGNQGVAMAGERDVLYAASGQQSWDVGYVGEVDTVGNAVKKLIEVTYGDLGFVEVDPQEPRRAFVGAFDGWYNDPDQALYLHLLYDGAVVDTLKLLDNYDEYDGLRDMAYDSLHQRLYLTVGSRVLVVGVNHGTPCAHPLAAVSVSGTSLGELGEIYTLRAIPNPSNATPPVTYAWSPEPLEGQGTAVVTYAWATAGDHVITLEAANCGGARSATHPVKIVAGELERVYLPLALR